MTSTRYQIFFVDGFFAVVFLAVVDRVVVFFAVVFLAVVVLVGVFLATVFLAVVERDIVVFFAAVVLDREVVVRLAVDVRLVVLLRFAGQSFLTSLKIMSKTQRTFFSLGFLLYFINVPRSILPIPNPPAEGLLAGLLSSCASGNPNNFLPHVRTASVIFPP